jgi:hypothetical protein
MVRYYTEAEVVAAINPRGLNAEEQYRLRDIVERLYGNMRDRFAPRICRSIPVLTDSANQFMERSWAGQVFAPLTPKRYIHDHFFWHSKVRRTNEDLILDPTGIPADRDTCEISSYSPYFGLLEFAPATHVGIYRAMKEIDAWGVRDFPPGFHP